MASIEFIEKRIEGKQKEITKLQNKLERIGKAEATGWKVNPYYYGESDKRYTLNELALAQKALEGYQAQLQEANHKAASRNVPAILEFLERWKKGMFEFYDKGLKGAYAEKQTVLKLRRAIESFNYGTPEYEKSKKAYEEAHKAYYAKLHGYFRDLTPDERAKPGFRYTHHVKIKEGEYEYILHYFEVTYEEAVAKLQKHLREEANLKYDFIIERTVAIVGTITDASGLEIGGKGDLNGYIKGTDGTAKVQTIGAGGYNIQCFHFRTLISEV